MTVKFRMSGMLLDEKEGVRWTFDFNGKHLLLAPAEPTTEENRGQYSLSGLRLVKILSEFDPQLKLEKSDATASTFKEEG